MGMEEQECPEARCALTLGMSDTTVMNTVFTLRTDLQSFEKGARRVFKGKEIKKRKPFLGN